MQSFTENFNILSSLGAIFMALSALFIILSMLSGKKSHLLNLIHKNILLVGLKISLVCLVGSLIYSNIIGYPPCVLCWWARILIYPQVVLFAVALYKKDRSVLDYSLVLSGIGIIISGFHYVTEMVGYSPLPCSAAAVSCLSRNVFEFGFVTIPFMGLSAFVLLFVAILSTKFVQK